MKSLIIITDANRAGGMLNAARKLGGTVNAAVVGSDELADKIAGMGFDGVTLFPTDQNTPPEAYAQPLAEYAGQNEPNFVLSSDSAPARFLLGAVAAKLGAAIIAGAASFTNDNGQIVVSKNIADGKMLEDLKIDGPCAAIFGGEDAESASTQKATVQKMPQSPDSKIKITGKTAAGGDSAGLLTAARVVGVGLGILKKDDLALINDLAAAMKAEVACTLPVCDDMRWYPPDRVVGSSHNQVAPELYVAVGISGQPQHMSGVRDAKVVVAINNDPDARVFKNCDYGILGDLYKIVPALTQAFRQIA